MPSHHSIVNGLPPLAFTPGNFHVTWLPTGQIWRLRAASNFIHSGSDSPITLTGATSGPSSMPSHTALIRWRPLSPIELEPKSRHDRQRPGW